MSQLAFTVDALELSPVGAESSEMIFLDDANYEFVGGGEIFNGY